MKHGIENHRDGPYGFTSPALVNTIYGRWWHPEDERPGPNALPGSPLKWTGDYLDGLGNKIHMMAYANPENRMDETKRSDGHGVVRFDKKQRTVTFECWPRFADVRNGDGGQFQGWPITIKMEDNDGRKPIGYLPLVRVAGIAKPVFQVIHESSGEVLYTVRALSNIFRAPVYREGRHTIRVGRDKPDAVSLPGQLPVDDGKELSVQI